MVNKQISIIFYPIFTIILFQISFVSCTENSVVTDVPLTEYVLKTISDTSSTGYKILSEYKGPDKSGVISVIGSMEESEILANAILSSDRFDNINGMARPDYLPDFAGENISVIMDIADAPYEGYLEAGNADFLGEIAVRLSLEAIKDRCFENPYEHEETLVKDKAKVIMLSSPYMTGYGYDDIVAMFEKSGKKIKLIAPFQSSLRYLAHKGQSSDNKEITTIGVWTDLNSGRTISKVCAKVFKGINHVCQPLEFTGNPTEDVSKFLNLYAAANHDNKLDGVVVNDLSRVEYVDSLNEAFLEIKELDSLKSLKYSQLVSDEFEFISPVDAMITDCYEYLRLENMLTHRAEYPKSEIFLSVPIYNPNIDNLNDNGFFKNDYKYGRACDSDIETFRIVQGKSRYMEKYMR